MKTMATSLSLPSPFPVSANLCQFQKGSGVSRGDATGCEVPCMDPEVAANQAALLFPGLDDETVWTAQAAIVSSCDECIYGPVEATIRDFVHDLKTVCCLDDSCLVGIINAILCNPILNYRARYIAANNAIAAVQQQNDDMNRAFAGAQASASATNANICKIVNAVKCAIAAIPQDGGQGSQTRCCLAACLNNLCSQTAGTPIPPAQLPLPCPCPPMSCEYLANACVVIKISCAPCGIPAGGGITCNETINCSFNDAAGNPCVGSGCGSNAGSGAVVIAGISFPAGCLLPTGAAFVPTTGSPCVQSDKAVVITFRGATNCVTGNGRVGVVA